MPELRRETLGHAVPRLLGAESPLAPKLFRDLFMGNAEARIELLDSLVDFREDVQVVEHVLECALVRKALEEGTDCVLGFHFPLRRFQRIATVPPGCLSAYLGPCRLLCWPCCQPPRSTRMILPRCLLPENDRLALAAS